MNLVNCYSEVNQHHIIDHPSVTSQAVLACRVLRKSIFGSVCMCEAVCRDYPGVFSPRLSLGDLLYGSVTR